MMNFLVICQDVPASDKLRQIHLKEHLAYVETILDQIQVAGPIADRQSGEYRSSCFIYRADNEAQALALLHNDPYYLAGLYQNYTINVFKAVAGNWVGGKNW